MILSDLREKTRQHHERLETRLDIINLTRSVDRYQSLLKRLYGFYEPLEAALASIPSLDPLPYSSRRKLPRIQKDLIALGNSPASVQALPICEELPALDSFARVLGCLYVLEGATLGGQIISRHLWEAHQFAADSGASFFSGYGPETGRMWKSFGAFLTENVDAGRCGAEEVIAGASDTFLRYEAWACPPLTTNPDKGGLTV